MTDAAYRDEHSFAAGFGPMYHYQYRLILIGDSTVGKSSLLKYFTEGRRAEISDPTVGVDFYARMIEISPDLRIKLQLWDTAGQEKFRIPSSWMNETDFRKPVSSRTFLHLDLDIAIGIPRSVEIDEGLTLTLTTTTIFRLLLRGPMSSELHKRKGSITRSYYRNSVGVILVYDISNRATFDHISDWLKEAENNVGGPQPGNCVFQLIGHKADLDEREVMYEEGEYFAKYHKIKFIETSAITGDNVQEAFLMIAREITQRLEKGDLQLVDGWEGIKSGMSVGKSISLADLSEDPVSSCYC